MVVVEDRMVLYDDKILSRWLAGLRGGIGLVLSRTNFSLEL